MDKYTYSNLIIDPTKEGIESLIGKEVYFHNNPSLCLENANEGSTDNLGILVEIFKNSIVPFRIEQKYGTCAHTCAHACIIPKKEEPKPKPKYEPFEDIAEFIGAYRRVEAIQLTKENFYLSIRGIWLKRKDPKAYVMVTELWDDGVVIECQRFTTPWDNLSYGYTFLDGSPCGKEVK